MEPRGVLLTVAILLIALCMAGVVWAAPMGTAFTYQGRLSDANSPAEGEYDMEFKLYDQQGGSNQFGNTVIKDEVDVIDGYFMVLLDFVNDPNVFDGDARWLQVAVRPGASSDPCDFATLSPRQEVTPAPYALYAGGDGDWTISGSDMYTGAGVTGNVGIGTTSPTTMLALGTVNPIISVASTDGSDSSFLGLTGGGALSNYRGSSIGLHGNEHVNKGTMWFRVGWDAATMTGANDGDLIIETANTERFRIDKTGNIGIGTTSPQAQLQVGDTSTGHSVYVAGPTTGQSAVWFYDGSLAGGMQYTFTTDDLLLYTAGTAGLAIDSDGNVGIGTLGPSAKLTVNGAILRDGSTMYGAGADTHINLGTNSTTGTNGQDYLYATVGGGLLNAANHYSTVGGGWSNTASGSTATVGGGLSNTASGGSGATVGGGYTNTASGHEATVGGGYTNTASGDRATVGGGYYNNASSFSATIPGGKNNRASGDYSFAAGRRAKADHAGSFVWGDSTFADFASTANDQFLIRASGGVGIGTDNPGAFQLAVNGSAAKTGGGSWSVFSDSRLKKNIEPLGGALDRMLQLEGVSFEYSDPDHFSYVQGRQLGMVAQEVEKVFPDWVDESGGYKTITFRGFEAITVEAFRQLCKEKDAEIAAQNAEIAALKERLATMEAAVGKLINTNEGGQL